MILVGAGSGLAPFRGFWEQVCLESSCDLNEGGRSTSVRARKNRLQLFFGCFDKEADILLDETDPLALDVLTRYSAYSRDPKSPKKYVQNLVLEQGQNVYDILINRNGRVYICGKISMAQSVTEAIADVIAKHAK